MARPKSKSKFHLYERKGNPNWWIWFLSDETGKIKRQSTGYRKSEYSRQYVLSIIAKETGSRHVPKYSVEWMEDYVIYRLELRERSEKTVDLYRLVLSHLKDLYGPEYSVYKIDRSVADDLQRRFKEKGISNTTSNSYLRTLSAAFERLVIDGKLDRNPLYRF